MVLLTVLCPGVAADEVFDGQYADFFERLPSDIFDRLPENDYGNDAASDAEALTSWHFWVELLGVLVGDGLRSAVPMLCGILGLLLIASLLRAVSASLEEKTAGLLELGSGCALAAATVLLQLGVLRGVVSYLSDLTLLVNGMTPIVLTLYASGGNVASAGVSAGALTLFLNVCENLLKSSILPFAGCCLCLSAAQACGAGLGFSGLVGLIKKSYTTALTFLMTLFCFLLGAQNIIAAGSDSLGLRAAKFVAGSSIPLVGGSVGESLKTLSTGISMLRRAFGVTGIVLIALLTLPTLLSLLLTRTVMNIGAAAADMLGVSREKQFLNELSGLYGCIAAVVTACSLMFVFVLILFANSATGLI